MRKIGWLLLLLGILTAQSGYAEESVAQATFKELWSRVAKLENEQKYRAALKLTEQIYHKALQAHNEQQWSKALIRVVLLKRGLHSNEQAVRFLMQAQWPQDQQQRALLHLFYANILYNYYQRYAWEINSREKVIAKRGVDLKKWTAFDIFAQIHQEYAKAYAKRTPLGQVPVSRFAEYIQRNGYPERIRGTMRDFICYQWVAFLSNTTTWRPVQLKEKYKLNFNQLLAPVTQRQAVNLQCLLDAKLHPLRKAVYILDDLYRWHTSHGRKGAALETQLQRFRCLAAIFNSKEKTDQLIQALKKLLPDFQDDPWWAAGQHQLATLLQRRGALVAAHSVAQQGYERYPKSLGGAKCLYLVRTLEQPSFSLQTMRLDKLGARSILITHKNITKLYLRAYRLDFKAWLQRKTYSFEYLNSKDWQRILRERSAVASWEVNLRDCQDYRQHKTYTQVPVKQHGLYAIMASLRADFKIKGRFLFLTKSYRNKIEATYMLFSNLVTILKPLRKPGQNGWEVLVVHGASGRPLAGVEVCLYRRDNRRGAQLVRKCLSEQDGRVQFIYRQRLYSCFIVARKGQDFCFDPYSISFRRRYQHHYQRQGCFIYTDRSIYRPLQKLYFKVVTYQGKKRSGEYRCIPYTKGQIYFRDPNGKQIASCNLRTNAYGTASGEFTIPKGRVLGRYMLVCEVRGASGRTTVRVEEYKRPTFEIKLKKPAKPLKLNQQVAIQGEARYYFGLPVSTGKIFYRITRMPVWPWWYWWYYPSQDRSRYTYEVASGKLSLQKDGTFAIPFVPKADPAMAQQKAITYHFQVQVEITDEGGETRTASRTYPIGFVAVRAAYQFTSTYYFRKENVTLKIKRSDLSGVPRAGQGQFRLVKIRQPDHVVTPAQLPLKIPAGQKYTLGDTLRPRWEADKPLQQFLFQFEDGALIRTGVLQHGKDGLAHLDFGTLPAGAYRLYYTTQDDWGTPYQTRRDFLVVGPQLRLAVPFLLLARRTRLHVGETALFFFGAGAPEQSYWLEFYQNRQLFQRRLLRVGNQQQVLEMPITAQHRGGFSVRLVGVYDYQIYQKNLHIMVPWDNKHLQVKFKTFRNLLRPGQHETWTISVRGPQSELVAAELLAYMYDRSLDAFVPHHYPQLDTLFPSKTGLVSLRTNLATQWFSNVYNNLKRLPNNPHYGPNRFKVLDSYPIGGLGRRFYRVYEKSACLGTRRRKGRAMLMADKARPPAAAPRAKRKNGHGEQKEGEAAVQAAKEVPLRRNFNETAFFQPHLLLDANGEARLEFQVPDSVTSWNVYVHAITQDIRFMTLKKETVSRKDLMVRPYVPRFFREGDQAVLKVVVNNATKKTLRGEVNLVILDPQTQKDCSALFGIEQKQQSWQAAGQGSANVSWRLKVPHQLGIYAFKVTAHSADYSDGELRPLPVLPSRIHLVQSKFVTLKGNQTRSLFIADMTKADQDPTLINQQLIVTIDAQLIYTVLKALPYLVHYPYECVEQTLNRFLCTGIVTSLYEQYPAIAKMARQFAKRKTRLDPWRQNDPNRKMALEETPWLVSATGGTSEDLINVLDARIAKANRDGAMAKLRKAQLPNGAFPWWPGGPASPYMTLYLLHGFAKAREFKIPVPRTMVSNAWYYLSRHFQNKLKERMLSNKCGYSFITFLNYVLSCYPRAYYRDAFSVQDRQRMLDYSFAHWKKHSPYLKAYLALTLMRADRVDDARLVFASIMDSAITKPDQGTFWNPEDRSWLWYNDTIESHAFVLRALQEITPQDHKHIDGVVLWLLLHKKLSQWKSTKATAEAIYALAYTMQKQKALAVRETAQVTIGPRVQRLVFEPDVYTGQSQIILRGTQIQPRAMARVYVRKTGPGYMFASMNWHYSTEKLPSEARGDFLAVTRRYYVRQHQGQEYVLRPLEEGAPIHVGDQVEVHLSIRTKHAMEYMHLRDPRGAGFEPIKNVSGHHWEFGLCWYQEVRDSGTNFFFEWLPHGEYNFRYRLRATMAGKFRVGSATLQSMYASEFTAFSRGMMIDIR